MIHFDYCCISKRKDSYRYVLIIKHDFGGFMWLVPTMEADEKNEADAILSWFPSSTTVVKWISDRGSHFKNDVVHEL